MKNQGKVPYDMEKLGKSVIPQWLDSETRVLIKAVDDETGESVGWLCLGFRGFEKDEMPVLLGAPQRKGDELLVGDESTSMDEEKNQEEKRRTKIPKSQMKEKTQLRGSKR